MSAWQIEFTIPSKAHGKERPRFSNGRTYTPKKTADRENLIRFYAMQAFGRDKDPVSFPLEVTIVATYTPPTSATKARKAAMLEGEIKYTKKPDADNIAKLVCDSLNNVVYTDDSNIVNLSVVKTYGNKDEIYVVIRKADDDGP